MIQILLVENQKIVRQGLKVLLEMNLDLQVVGEAEDHQPLIQLVQELDAKSLLPDVILMDVSVRDRSAALKLLCQQFPHTKIIILTAFDDGEHVLQALRYGAKGYFSKRTPVDELVKAIRLVYQGYTQFGPGILEKIIDVILAEQDKPKQKAPPELWTLTVREQEILRMIAAGNTNREIAQMLYISQGTVKNQVSSILNRLNLNNRTQAALIAKSFLFANAA